MLYLFQCFDNVCIIQGGFVFEGALPVLFRGAFYSMCAFYLRKYGILIDPNTLEPVPIQIDEILEY